MARRSSWVASLGLVVALVASASGCKRGDEGDVRAEGIVGSGGLPALSKAANSEPVPLPSEPETMPKEGGPRLGAVEFGAPIFAGPDRRSDKLGYLRAGGTVVRAEKPVKTDDCEGGWYRIAPAGFVCASSEATTNTTTTEANCTIRCTAASSSHSQRALPCGTRALSSS